MRKSLGWHKYRRREKGPHGEWRYFYDDPPTSRQPAPDLNFGDRETSRAVESLIMQRAADPWSHLYDMHDSKVAGQLDQEEKAEQAGYTYRYHSSARAIHGSSLRAVGVEDAAVVGDHLVMTKHPLGVRELHALELSPIDRQEQAEAVIDYYHQRFGDGPIVLMASPPVRDESEDDEEWAAVRKRYIAKKRGVVIHHSTKGSGYQATYFDADGFSHDTSARDLAELVGRMLSENYRKPVSPDSFDRQVESEQFTAGEERNRAIHAEWDKQKSHGGRLMDTHSMLAKARKGDQVAGHKYTSRHRNAKGEWEYTYASGIGHATGHLEGAHQADLFGEEHAVAQGGDHGELPTPAKIRQPAPMISREHTKRKYEFGPNAKAIRLPPAEHERLDRRDNDVTGAYPFDSGNTFYTSKQIDQMVDLVELWALGGRGTKVRSDSISRAVEGWGTSFDLLGYGQVRDRYDEKVKDPEGLYIEGAYRRKPFGKNDAPDRNFMNFSAIDQLPPEALWRLVDKHIIKGRDHVGRSIAQESGWVNLNLFPEGRYGHSNSDLDDMARVLVKLQSWGYVYAQFGGSVWSIDVTPEYRATKKSQGASDVSSFMAKARKGEQAAGHKYEARTWDQQAGHWVYHYRAKDDPNNLTADHIFEIMNRNKVAGLRQMGTYVEWAGKEGTPEQQRLINRLDATTYGMNWAVQTGRLSGTTAMYLERLEGKELAKVIAAVLPHVQVQGDVPKVLIKMWGSDEHQAALRQKIQEMDQRTLARKRRR